jgi:hypothetical protein
VKDDNDDSNDDDDDEDELEEIFTQTDQLNKLSEQAIAWSMTHGVMVAKKGPDAAFTFTHAPISLLPSMVWHAAAPQFMFWLAPVHQSIEWYCMFILAGTGATKCI